MITIAASNPDNWVLSWQLPIPVSVEPLPRQYCPTSLGSPVVKGQLNLVGGFHSGKLGGYLNQHIETGLIGSSAGGARVGGGKKIFVDQLQIILFEVRGDYQLSFDLLTRIASPGSLSIFEYIGAIN
jgi:hypothetical protein